MRNKQDREWYRRHVKKTEGKEMERKLENPVRIPVGTRAEMSRGV
jgi:hypothetical protein